MLIFNVYAIRVIVSAVIFCSLVAPPTLLLQTRVQLRLTGFPANAESGQSEVKSEPNVQQVPTTLGRNSWLSLETLERTVLKPNDGIKVPLVASLDSLSHTSRSPEQSDTPTVTLSDSRLLAADDQFEEPLVCPNTSLSDNLDSIFPVDSSIFTAKAPCMTFAYQPSAITPLALLSTKQPFSLLPFLKWLRLYLCEQILSSLPKHWSEWMINDRVTHDGIFVFVMYWSFFALLMHCLQIQIKAKNKLNKALQAANSTKLFVDIEMSKLNREKHEVTDNLSLTKDLVRILEQEISSTKLKFKELHNSKYMTQIKLHAMASELQFMECEVERMEEEETEQKNITDELISEKSELSQLFTEQKKNNFTLSQQVDELTEENTSLVDILSTYKEARMLMERELINTKEQTVSLQDEASFMSEELEVSNTQLVEQEREIAELMDCLSEVTHQTAQLATTQGTDYLNTPSTDNLISDVQTHLEQFEEFGEEPQHSVRMELSDKELVLEELNDENNTLKNENSRVEAELIEARDELTRTQLNYKGVTDYFASKEDTLRRELYNRETQMKELEKLEEEAKERLQKRTEEFEQEREEWTVTNRGLEELLKSIDSQVHISQDKAQRALGFVNATEQKLSRANEKIMTLKKSLRNSQKRPTQQSQQSRRLDVPPVCPQSTITLSLLTPPVRGTREYTVDDSESGDDQHHTSTSLHTTTKQLTQTDTQDHATTEASSIVSTNLNEVIATDSPATWNVSPDQLLSEKLQDDQLELHTNLAKTDSTETSTVDERLNEDITAVTVISSSLSSGLANGSSPEDTQEDNVSTPDCDHVTVESWPVINKREKYLPRRSSPLLQASKSQSTNQSAIYVNNDPFTEGTADSLSSLGPSTLEILMENEQTMKALNCGSNDSGVSMSSEAVPRPAARWEYTHTIVETREDGDTDSILNAVDFV